MSSKSNRGRTCPRKLKQIQYVDGFKIRNIWPDFSLIESWETSAPPNGPFIPKPYIWIDKRFETETGYLLKVFREAQRVGKQNPNWNSAAVRSHLIATFINAANSPTLGELTVRTERYGGLVIRYVRGEVLRKRIDPWFWHGGHDLVYKWIADLAGNNEIWLDARQDPEEIPYTFEHELDEHTLMAPPYSWTYIEAHTFAMIKEKARRQEKLRAPRDKRIQIKTFEPTDSFCGPAALKLCLDCFGLEYKEKFIGELCETVALFGTDHAPLIRAAKSTGALVFEKSNGTINELRRFVLRERLPVLVGLWDGPYADVETVVGDKSRETDQGHYVVVYHVDNRYIHLADPYTESGRRRMSIQRFLAMWWDYNAPNALDQNRLERVDRWYMVLNFDGAKFNIPGGINH